MAETWKAHEAFERYYMMGPERSIKKVAEYYGVSEQCIARWSKKHDWVRRAYERDRKNMLAMEEKDNADFIEQMRQYKKLITASVGKYVDSLKKNHVKVETVKDFNTLVRLDMDLNNFINSTNDRRLEQLENGGTMGNGYVNGDPASEQTLNTVTKILAEASRFGGLEELSEDIIVNEENATEESGDEA